MNNSLNTTISPISKTWTCFSILFSTLAKIYNRYLHLGSVKLNNFAFILLRLSNDIVYSYFDVYLYSFEWSIVLLGLVLNGKARCYLPPVCYCITLSVLQLLAMWFHRESLYVTHVVHWMHGHSVDENDTEGPVPLPHQCGLPKYKCKSFVHNQGIRRCLHENYECRLNKTVLQTPTQTCCRIRKDDWFCNFCIRI